VGNITFADITVPTTLSSKAAYDLLAKAIAMRFSSSSDAGAMDDSGADASLDGGVDGAAVDAGPPVLHADTLYTLLLPPETTLKDVSCDIGAYHDAMVLNGVDAFPYAIVRQDCDYDWRSMVNNAVHELVEAATDPFPHVYPGPGVLGIGLRFVAWDYANQNEIADLCIGIPSTSPDVPSLNNGNTKLTFPTVWSNRLAAMGQNPCVPMDPEAPHVFASAWAILPEVAPDSIATGAPWVRLAVGDSTTVDVHVASDGPADLTLLAYDFASQDGSSPAQLDVSLDSTSAHNGDVRKLTIKRLSVQRTMYDPDGVSVFGIATSQANGDGFVTYGIVGVP
jgi:hypothetical protein